MDHVLAGVFPSQSRASVSIANQLPEQGGCLLATCFFWWTHVYPAVHLAVTDARHVSMSVRAFVSCHAYVRSDGAERTL